VSENQVIHPVATLCRVLGVSSSGYYAWSKRSLSRRAKDDAVLIERIGAIHAASKGTYGAPRIHAELKANGIPIGKKRVARLMRRAGLAGVSRRRFVTTTVRDGARQAPDLVERDFTAERPNLLWVADITYIPTWAGFLYLAVALDAFSRRIVGWAMATTLHTQLVLDALNMALATRRPKDVVHHSDQGSQLGFNRSSQHHLATSFAAASKASAGVCQPSVFRGRALSEAATAANSSGPWSLKSVPFGKYCRSKPFVFSLEPRCQGLRGSQK
jgi:putative transposase